MQLMGVYINTIVADNGSDLYVSGMQRGLNNSGDFADTIGEFAVQYSDAGFSADEFFSILETGGQGGAHGTAKISDAIKEMNIRLNDGSDETKEAFPAEYNARSRLYVEIRRGEVEHDFHIRTAAN